MTSFTECTRSAQTKCAHNGNLIRVIVDVIDRFHDVGKNHVCSLQTVDQWRGKFERLQMPASLQNRNSHWPNYNRSIGTKRSVRAPMLSKRSKTPRNSWPSLQFFGEKKKKKHIDWHHKHMQMNLSYQLGFCYHRLTYVWLIVSTVGIMPCRKRYHQCMDMTGILRSMQTKWLPKISVACVVWSLMESNTRSYSAGMCTRIMSGSARTFR